MNNALGQLTFIPYDRDRAVEYARRWALSRNPLFTDYTGIGGDCTNFVSQAIYAGTCVQNYTRDLGWYYISPENRAPAWTSVEYFYDFMTGSPDFIAENGGTGPFGFQITLDRVRIGDVIQLADEAGDFYHTLIVSKVEDGEIYICAHSNDALDRPLSSYNNASERAIMIAGARTKPVYPCFEELMKGSVVSLRENDDPPSAE